MMLNNYTTLPSATSAAMDTSFSTMAASTETTAYALPSNISYTIDGSSVPSLSSSNGTTPSASQQWKVEDVHDPTLHYINHLLMEEDIHDEDCTLHESIAFQDTVKSFSDILNHNNEHLLSSKSSYGDEFRSSEQEEYCWRPAEEHSLAVQMRLDETEPQREDTLARISSAEFPLQQDNVSLESQALGRQATLDIGSLHPERRFSCELGRGYVHSESYVAPMLQTTKGSTKNEHLSNGSLKQSVLNETLKQHILKEKLKQHVSEKQQNGLQNLNIHMYCDTGSASQAHITKRHYPFNISTEENLGMFANLESTTNSSRLKAAPPKKASIDSTQPVARGTDSFSSDGDDGDDTDNGHIESLSFVGNEDLKAEMYAKVLKKDLTSLIEIMRNSGLKPSPAPKAGKSNASKLATTADLKNILLSCAQAVTDGKIRRANEILRDIRQEASPYGTGVQRLAHYFAEGLAARITGTGAAVYKALTNNLPSTGRILKSHGLLVDVSIYHKFSYVFSSRAIVEAAKDACRLHIIDYGIWYGIQWPSLISALAVRKGGPPYLRMTIIDFPEPVDNPAKLAQWTAQKLSEYAREYGVPFEYQVIVEKWENVTASTVGLREGELVVVNSTFRLRNVLDGSVTSSDPRTTVLKNILGMNPKLFLHGVFNASYTSPFFLPRFREAFCTFSSLFDMMEAIAPSDSQERLMFEREFYGRAILNAVACEGEERVERPETYKQWQSRMERVGFVQIPLDGNMIKNFQDIVRTHYNKNNSVDMDENWLLFGWKGKVLMAFTLWRPGMAV